MIVWRVINTWSFQKIRINHCLAIISLISLQIRDLSACGTTRRMTRLNGRTDARKCFYYVAMMLRCISLDQQQVHVPWIDRCTAEIILIKERITANKADSCSVVWLHWLHSAG